MAVKLTAIRSAIGSAKYTPFVLLEIRCGIIDKAITQIGRKIVVDADLALALAKESGGIHIKE